MLTELKTELVLRGMSKKTQETYFKYNQHFLKYITKDAKRITKNDIKSFLASLIEKGTAPRTINLVRSALLFYYNEVLELGIVGIKVPKIAKSLPVYLTKEEVRILFRAAGSTKSKLIMQFLYSSGLRVSEICTLKIEDMDLRNRKGFVRHGKGGKDRLFFIAHTLAIDLEIYLRGQKRGYVFTNYKQEKLSERNIQKIVRGAGIRAELTKQVTPHKLRHSFATHLHDAGTSIRTIQALLGHSNLATTEIYTHISDKKLKDVKNPLDRL
jgi:integrase/recombinase XerD